jgi:uncharacterized membrane protein YbaN (DUF454 family)
MFIMIRSATMYNLYPPKWQIYAVLVTVFSSILLFLPSPERWLTFGLFAAILGPVAYCALKDKKPLVNAMYNPYPPKWQVYAVLLIVFSLILYFLPSPVKWWTFGLAAAILGPVTYAMLTAKKPPVRNYMARDEIEIDYIGWEWGNEQNHNFGYIPGIRDFDGSYFGPNHPDK